MEAAGFEGSYSGDLGRKFGLSYDEGGGVDQFLDLSALLGQGFGAELLGPGACRVQHPLSHAPLHDAI